MSGLVSAFFLALLFLTDPAPASSDFTGKAIRIIDGDSLKVMHNGLAEEIRLNGIDCPENSQAFGHRAKELTSDLAFGKEVTANTFGYDKYGRTIADVILPGGVNLNQELVKAGMCWWYREYAPNDTVLGALEREARDAKRGLWADPEPVPPWVFRKSRRRQLLDLAVPPI